VPSCIVTVEHDLVAREAPRAKVSDEFVSLGVAERAEDGSRSEDARDCLSVHAAERYARACVCHRNHGETSTETFVRRY